MSLFGGGDTTSGDEQPSSVSGSRLQGEQDVVQSASEGDAENLGSDTDENTSVGEPEVIPGQAGFLDDEEKDQERPNKYHGPAATWRGYTEAERKLAASINLLRAADLSIHLYNAHSLKRRIRHPDRAAALPNWKSKERWRVPPGRIGTEEESAWEDGFYPPRGWTAWPMKPELVPREGEKSISRDFRAGGIYRSGFVPKNPKLSEPLEECVFAEMLKIAKESFLKRKIEDDALRQPDERVSTPGQSQPSRREAAKSSRSRERRESTSTDERDSPSAEQMQSPSPSGPFSNLALMADDEEAQKLLHPAVRHILSKLDALLMGLHQARENYLSSSSEDGSSHGQPEDTENVLEKSEPRRGRFSTQISEISRNSSVKATARRGRGRPPKHPGVVIVPEHFPTKNEQGELSRGKGRPRRYPKDFEKQQTYYMMRKLEKQGEAGEPPIHLLHDETPSEYEAESESESDSQSVSKSDISDSQLSGRSSMPTSSSRIKKRRRIGDPVRKARYRKKKQAQLGPRDWSDVLGIASMVGWDPDVVSRAATKCSKLFGEGMQFRTLNEEDTFLKEARNGDIVNYRPDKIPSLTPEGLETSFRDPSTGYEDGEEYERGALPDHIQEQVDVVRGEGRESKDLWSLLEDRLLREVKALRPPLSFRQIAVYFPKRSIAACKSRWRWTKILEEDDGTDSQDDDMIGGLHNDGFLKPIKRQRGWRGEDHRQRKTRKIDKGKGRALEMDSD